ncbi:MAG TPA: L-threonylcarbamoyladenylate synthase [Nitrospirota bacterium]|nr:L-threonylcarbamoyladenylate synthase [Nitrospirota bacterium]
MQIIKIDQSDPDPVVVSEIAGLLKSGAVIAFPTDTYYGLGVDIDNDEAIKKIFAIKGRPYNQPILILISDRKDLKPLISRRGVPVFADRLMDKFWPGPLTIVFHASEGMSEILTGSAGKIGIRLPAHPFCRSLVRELGRPLTATSANISGKPSLCSPSDVRDAIGDRIDALVDGGMTQGGAVSTVIDATGAELVMIREGVISEGQLREIFSGEKS